MMPLVIGALVLIAIATVQSWVVYAVTRNAGQLRLATAGGVATALMAAVTTLALTT